MKRLTEKDSQGNWRLKGVPWCEIHEGRVIGKMLYERLYGALWKLMQYEDTGLDPDDVERINDFEKSRAGILVKKLNEEQEKHRWIPVAEKLPEDNEYILLSFENFTLPAIGRYERDEDGGGVFYLGDCDGSDTCVNALLFVNAWMPLPEPYVARTEMPAVKEE